MEDRLPSVLLQWSILGTSNSLSNKHFWLTMLIPQQRFLLQFWNCFCTWKPEEPLQIWHERLHVMKFISTSLYFYQRYNMTHVWNSYVYLLILSWRRGNREASPTSQQNREHLSDIFLAASWKIGPPLPPHSLENPFKPVLYTSQNISEHASSLLGQKHFHIQKSISLPFKKSCKNGLRLLVIKSSFWGRCSLYSKCEKKLLSVWSKLKRKFWKYNLPSIDFHRNDWLCKWAAVYL